MSRQKQMAYRHYWFAADSQEASELRSLPRTTDSLNCSRWGLAMHGRFSSHGNRIHSTNLTIVNFSSSFWARQKKMAYRHYWFAADSQEDSELRSLPRTTDSLNCSRWGLAMHGRFSPSGNSIHSTNPTIVRFSSKPRKSHQKKMLERFLVP